MSYEVKVSRRVVLAGMGATALGTLAAPALVRAQGRPKEVTIAALCSLTGAAASFGAAAKTAFEVRAAEINAAGGLWGDGNGMIKLTLSDDQSKADIAVAEFSRLASDAATTSVISLLSSAAMLQASIEAERQSLVMVNAGSVAKDVNERGLKYTFSTCNNTDGIVRSYLEFTDSILKKSGVTPKKIALVYENKFAGPSYRKAWGDLYSTATKWPEPLDFPYDPASTDFTTLISQLKSQGVDFPVLSGYPQDTILLIRTMREQNYEPIAISGFFGALPNIEVTNALGKTAEFIMGQSPYLHDMNVAGAKEFVSAFQQKTGKLPDALAGLGYNAMSALTAALKSVEDVTDRDAVRDAMAKLNVPVGTDGVIIPDAVTINEKGANPAAKGGYFQIRGGVHKAVLPSEFATTELVFPRPKWSEYPA